MLPSILAKELEPRELRLLYKSYDIVGDIAIIRISKDLRHKIELIAQAIMQTHKHVKTVLCQSSPVSGSFRLRKLEWIIGEKKTETIHKEFGCFFKVDLEKCYFSPRLSFERMRIAKQVRPGEVVVNMFAGVGCYSILIAKYTKGVKVYSIDLNPEAIHYMTENIRLNNVQKRVVEMQGDAKSVIQQTLRKKADRVLMPLPEIAYEYINYALLALKSTGGWIHYYDFEHARKPETPLEKTKAKILDKLCGLKVSFDISSCRIVRMIGPNWYQTVIDILIY